MKTLAVVVSVLALSVAFADEPEDMMVSGSGPAEYVAPLVVTNVRNYAFCDNRGILKIMVENAVDVGTCAFRGCVSLRELRLPALASLSKFAGMFAGCVNLRNVYLDSYVFDKATAIRAGFPWQIPNNGVIFHFANGDFDRNGNQLQ